jgi:hypothetical protein
MEKIIASWDDVSLDDLFFAYRKAKADCYFETSIRIAEKFLRFEEAVGENLSALLEQLRAGDVGRILTEGLGEPAIFPKKVRTGEPKARDSASHAFFSDATRSFQYFEQQGVTPEFRMIGDFSVEVHVISALWVNLVGHKYDEKLGANALASRLRRYRKEPESGAGVGAYHLEAIGSFEPYFEPYKRWRDSGLQAIKSRLVEGESVAVLTLDVSNFYHSIDPSFSVHPAFLEYLDIRLSQFQLAFTTSIVVAIQQWSSACREKVASFGSAGTGQGGMPIGLSAVRLLANVILAFLDREIESSVFPLYYARYVDDVFLVLKDNENFGSQADLWHMLQLRVLSFQRDELTEAVNLQLPAWGGSSRLQFQPEKQKCFFLSGRSGLDLLENVASQIKEVSSERRLMPLPEQLDQTQSARALTATNSSEEADTLRRADGLTLRRLGWSVLLRSVEVLARDLNPKDWVKERQRFYDFAHDHVIRPDKILEQIDRLPRLFSIAVSLGDWREALRVWRETLSSIFELQRATSGSPMIINGQHCRSTPSSVWDDTRLQVRKFFREALFRAFAVEAGEPKARAYHSLLNALELTSSELNDLARLARETDWARVPYKEHLRLHADRHSPSRLGEELLYGRYPHEESLRRYLERSIKSRELYSCNRVHQNICDIPYESLVPFLFPTRAYTPEEIALYLPSDCVLGEPVSAAHAWAEYTRAVRGVWVRSELADEAVPPRNSDAAETEESQVHTLDHRANPSACTPSPAMVEINGEDEEFPVRVGITSFSTSDATWALAASGKPDVSPGRYKAIADIVNHALREEKRPTYLVFPELSVPERWVRTISTKLREGGISLIAGLDYVRYPGDLIDSSAVMVLDDHRLGYSASLQIRQRKSQPAPGEEENLFASHGQSWRHPRHEPKPIYAHRGFYFSVIVCSELQNIGYRKELQGRVDALFILSWNKDLDTFAALVDAASLDVHAYVALSNNLRYGDSRVRSPAKESFRRDVCRVRGGVNNQLVVVNIDPRNLRAQQSRVKRWSRKGDAYKPAPEGFRISDARKTTPS